MNTAEIKEWLYADDKKQVADKYKVDYSYLTKLLNGEREANSKLAKKVMEDLAALAEANQQAQLLKQEYLTT